jgi:hypothetical protein
VYAPNVEFVSNRLSGSEHTFGQPVGRTSNRYPQEYHWNVQNSILQQYVAVTITARFNMKIVHMQTTVQGLMEVKRLQPLACVQSS